MNLTENTLAETALSDSPLGERSVGLNRLIFGTLLFVAIAVIGLLAVKWAPDWHKAHVAAATHSIGSSIISGKSAVSPVAGVGAAWGYAFAYFKSVWQAVVLALLLGACVQVFVPRKWLLKLIGYNDYRSTAVGGAISLAGMMCTCCTAPIVVGLRRQRANMGGALAFFLGNPVLNPATILFIGFVLGWRFAALRIAFGLVLVFVVAWLANRYFSDSSVDSPNVNFVASLAPIEEPGRTPLRVATAWFKELWVEIYTILPGYIAIVLILGAVRAWLFPPGLTLHAAGFGAIALLSAIGTLFVIPTAGEVPIVQTLMHAGMSTGPATALLMTLPAISLPSLFIVRNVFPKRVLGFVTAGVFVVGIVAGLVAMFTIHHLA